MPYNPVRVDGIPQFDSQVLFADGTAAAPALAWANTPGQGFSRPGADAIGVSGALRLQASQTLGWSAADGNFTTVDVVLSRGAANRLDLASGDDFNLADGRVGANKPGIATTSTDAFLAQNATAATAGVTVQYSPRFRLTGTAWDTDDTTSRNVQFFNEVLPVSGATVSGTYRVGFIDPVSSAVTYPMTLTSAGALTTLGAIQASSSGGFELGTGGDMSMTRGGSGRLQVLGSAAGVGVTLNVATDAVLNVYTRGNTDAATINASAYQVGGTAGASFGPGAVTSITVVNGIVTAIS